MEKITKKYIDLRDKYNDYIEKVEKGELTEEDSKSYKGKVNDFCEEARIYYGNEKIDADYALDLFNRDGKLQTELMAYDINENKEESKGHTL